MRKQDKAYVINGIKYRLEDYGIKIDEKELCELLLDTACIFNLSKWIKNLKKINNKELIKITDETRKEKEDEKT